MRLRTFGGLWIEDAAHAAGSPRPRSLALLAIVAAAGAKGATRDQVIGLLWPDSPSDRARHVLSQTLYGLRKELGVDAVQGGAELRLDADRLTTDVGELREALRRKDWVVASTLYQGTFLDGFYLADAPEFERWVETERRALEGEGLRAIVRVAQECQSAGRAADAADYWRRAARLAPLEARFAVSYMESLIELGDRTAALAHGDAHAALVRSELESDPDPTVVRMIAKLRTTHVPEPRDEVIPIDPKPPLATASETVADAAIPIEAVESEPARHSSSETAVPLRATERVRGFRFVAAAAVVAGIALLASLSSSFLRSPAGERPVLAVGRIRDVGLSDSMAFAGVSSEMLATSLGRVPDLDVIAQPRMVELMPRNGDTSHASIVDAARRAGAGEMIEGEIIGLSDHRMRLELRRVDLRRGIVRAGYQIVGDDRIALLDSATVLIARQFGVSAPRGSLAEVSTRSPVAYRLYDEGLHRMYDLDLVGARHLFGAAAREDSSFAMALYYLWRVAHVQSDSDRWTLADRVLRLASRAPDRDRLLMTTNVLVEKNDLRSLAVADTLASRYPDDPEGLIRAAEAFNRSGTPSDLARATMLANRSIAIDSAAAASSAMCRVCEAFSLLVARYSWADSLGNAEATARRWIHLHPDDPEPWSTLSDVLVALGKRSDAEAASAQALARGQPRGDDTMGALISSLRTDDFAGIDSACATGLRSPGRDAFGGYRWFCVIGLRMEGRYREAFALAREGRIPGTDVRRTDAGVDSLIIAILNIEAGRPLDAVPLFLTRERMLPSAFVRDRAWALTLAATAALEGGDSVRARGLVDSIESIGRRSMFGRDPLLHRFVRGSLLARAHQDVAAARELRASIFSPTNGYTRANYELGKALLAAGRPADAIPVVRAALHGGVEGSGLYLTRTQVHELLAQLFAAAGKSDSAAAHYAVVERAWRRADATLQPRYEAARRAAAGTSAAATASRGN